MIRKSLFLIPAALAIAFTGTLTQAVAASDGNVQPEAATFILTNNVGTTLTNCANGYVRIQGESWGDIADQISSDPGGTTSDPRLFGTIVLRYTLVEQVVGGIVNGYLQGTVQIVSVRGTSTGPVNGNGIVAATIHSDPSDGNTAFLDGFAVINLTGTTSLSAGTLYANLAAWAPDLNTPSTTWHAGGKIGDDVVQGRQLTASQGHFWNNAAEFVPSGSC